MCPQTMTGLALDLSKHFNIREAELKLAMRKPLTSTHAEEPPTPGPALTPLLFTLHMYTNGQKSPQDIIEQALVKVNNHP